MAWLLARHVVRNQKNEYQDDILKISLYVPYVPWF